MDIESIIVTTSYLGIFGLMTLNGFASFPSSQILYIIVGYFIGTGALALLPAVLVGASGNALGNVLLYEAIRKHGIHYIERFKIFRKEDVKRVEIVFRNKGLWFLFVGKLLPAIKVFVPIPAAIGKVHRGAFAGIMFAASAVWALGFIAIGYVFGKSADVFKSYGAILVVVALGVMYLFYRILNSPEVEKELQKEEEEVSRSHAHDAPREKA